MPGVLEAGCEPQVVSRELLDSADLSRCAAGAFDAVVCYGGPLSYMFDRTEEALQELLRVTRPGGHLLLSVMSLVGTTRAALTDVLGFIPEHGLDAVDRVMHTGEAGAAMTGGYICHMTAGRS